MNHKVRLLIATVVACGTSAGCGGTSAPSPVQSSTFNGIYRTAFNRGNSAITLYLNFPKVEIVVTDEAGVYPSYVGSSTSAVTLANGVYSFTALQLAGSDGESALASGSFGINTIAGSGNAVNLTLTGGIGFTAQAPLITPTTNSLYAGTYTGTYSSAYTVGTTTTTQMLGTVTSLTMSADQGTGGYDLSATGTSTDPSGIAVNFTISHAQVDPCGIITGLTVVYAYPTSNTASVTNSYSSAYLNLGVISPTTFVGYLKSASSTWPNQPVETDTLVLNQTSATLK